MTELQCDYCEEVFTEPDLGPIELFGSQVYYAVEGEPESQILVGEEETVCHDCAKEQHFDEDEREQYGL